MVFVGPVRRLALQNIKARIPLIKFRRGSPSSHDHTTSDFKDATQVQTAFSTEAIEDWQLPPRFQRRFIDDEEINYINQGGAI